jgi:hypothetical protein
LALTPAGGMSLANALSSEFRRGEQAARFNYAIGLRFRRFRAWRLVARPG